jgi:hypothetical protein
MEQNTEIRNERRCGNSTRQVDGWIQDYFNNGEVTIIDHAHKQGNFANRHTLDMFIRRLQFEHDLILHKHFKYDLSTNKVTKINQP